MAFSRYWPLGRSSRPMVRRHLEQRHPSPDRRCASAAETGPLCLPGLSGPLTIRPISRIIRSAFSGSRDRARKTTRRPPIIAILQAVLTLTVAKALVLNQPSPTISKVAVTRHAAWPISFRSPGGSPLARVISPSPCSARHDGGDKHSLMATSNARLTPDLVQELRS